jgi:hypothetical protein
VSDLLAALLQTFGLSVGLSGFANVLQCTMDFNLTFCGWEKKTK